MAASNPSQNYNITFSGKLIDERSLAIKGATIYFLADYLDNKPGHAYAFNRYLARTDVEFGMPLSFYLNVTIYC
jgi:hypothetical protein